MDRRDIRMIERCEELRLAREPRKPLRVAGEHRGKHLDRDVATKLHIACSVHLTHAANAEQLAEPERADLLASLHRAIIAEQLRPRRLKSSTLRFRSSSA